MNHDRMLRRRSIKLGIAVLAVGLIMSGLVALALVYMGQTRPHF